MYYIKPFYKPPLQKWMGETRKLTVVNDEMQVQIAKGTFLHFLHLQMEGTGSNANYEVTPDRFYDHSFSV